MKNDCKLKDRKIDWIQWGRRHYYLGPKGLINDTSLKLHVSHLMPRLPDELIYKSEIYRLDFTFEKIKSLIRSNENPLDFGNTKYLDKFHEKVIKNIKNPDIVYTLANGFEIMPNINANIKIHDQVACHVWLAEIKNKYSGYKINLDMLLERETRLFKSVDLVICPSEIVETYVKSLCPEVKTTIVRFPIREIQGRHKKYTKNEGFNVLFVGRVEEAKGINLVFELAKKFPKINFQCVGQILIDPLKTPNNVTLHGRVPHEKINSYYENADLFLFPSLSEGSATVTQEAMAYGLPGVVSYQAGSHYVNDVSGYLLDAYDFEGFSNALERLEADRILLEKFRIEVQLQALQYTEERYHKELHGAICENLD